VIDCIEQLRSVLFPGYFGYREFRQDTMHYHVGATLDNVAFRLQDEIRHAVRYVFGREYEREYAQPEDVERIVDEFIECLPQIRQQLVLDCQASFEWDPAAFIPEAPVFCYPNMLAMMNYRLAHELYIRNVPFIPRIITEHAHHITGIDIHPGAQIGESFFVDHGTGVVIGQTAEVGDRVRLYQGVTLGAMRFPLDPRTQRPIKGIPRHPVVEDDVVIYAEATILGRITVGRGSIIGANVFLAKSVPPESKVFAPPARVGHLSREEKERGADEG
jgi:serine O-acetyltransferase